MAAAMNQANQFIAIDNLDSEIAKRTVGRIVFWSLGGDTPVEGLAAALLAEGSKAEPPAAPSALVALHRACESFAKADKAEVHHKRRGEWAIVGKGHVAGTEQRETHEEGAVLIYPIHATARVEGDALVVEGKGEEQIREKFNAARERLAPADIGSWLSQKVKGLGGVALRENGGFYFIPQDRVESWERLTKALHAVSPCRAKAIPSMKSDEAVEAILSAIVEDTRSACAKLAEGLREVGERALETRRTETDALLERVGRYEGLLGKKLDELREEIENTKAATIAAMMAIGSEAP